MPFPVNTEHRVPLSDFDRKQLLTEKDRRHQWLRLAGAGMATAVALTCITFKPNAEAGVFIFLMIAALALITVAYVQIEKLDAIKLELEHQTTLVVEGVLERRVIQDDEGNDSNHFLSRSVRSGRQRIE